MRPRVQQKDKHSRALTDVPHTTFYYADPCVYMDPGPCNLQRTYTVKYTGGQQVSVEPKYSFLRGQSHEDVLQLACQARLRCAGYCIQ